MERRKHDRFEVEFPVSFTGENLAGSGTVQNLSREGCLIESDATPQEGSYLNLSLHLSDHHLPMQIKSAAVRWVSGPLFGIQFLYMTQEAHARLDCLLDTLEKLQRQS